MARPAANAPTLDPTLMPGRETTTLPTERDTWLGPWRLLGLGSWFVRERLAGDTYEMVCVPALASVNADLVRPLVALPRGAFRHTTR